MKQTISNPAFDMKQINVLNSHYQTMIDNGVLQCASYMMSRGGEVFAAESLGEFTGGQNEKQTFQLDTIREIGSLTKVFTAVAVMQLVEKGLLDLKMPVKLILPAFDKPGFGEIKILHLLTHTAGLSFELDIQKAEGIDLTNEEEWINYLVSTPLEYGVDEAWNYSRTGFVILGIIISKVTGVSYEQYVTKHIIEALGLERTYFYVPDALKEEVCVINEHECVQLEKSHHPYFPNKATSGLYSSLRDIWKLAEMFRNKGRLKDKKLLGRKTVEAMLRNQIKPGLPFYFFGAPREEGGFGLGINLWPAGDHYFMTEGTFSHLGMGWCGMFSDPAEDFTYVFFTPISEFHPHAVLTPLNIVWAGIE
ncbi:MULTISPECIES: serine hydrolase domain-containing protein [Bacillus]|uniref:serine hydrolase domain-containing protein n=1 Tax=Bacillus TaxID=1386 RepID=UPI0002E13B29|nr:MULTISPECIES: serine hydrolase domain-containing protein [Bacillus]MEC0952765.1 serine hydrolase [Bacillus velezensis]MED3706785.1 serine hydrolase [Bacillus velezensis]QGI72098.1 serine hydrolase [Bacillus velezensis]QNE08212.1 beta-lactamase family protein [Bacillus velezensis]UHY18253.1 beta-lactamase family protein [Bacillus velezensis]